MQLRWGILSSGLISGDFVRSLKSLDPNHHKVVAIGSTRLESAKEFARKFNIPKAYGSYEELVKDKDIDVIYVSTKTILHFAAAKLCITNRKHVLIEKPMTTCVEHTRKLFELGKEYNVFVLEALFSRFVPGYIKLRELLKSNTIGDLVHIQSNFVMSNTSDGILFKKYGGGVNFAVFITAVYGLNAIFEAVNYKKPTKISAIGRSLIKNDNKGDCTVSAILDFGPDDAENTKGLTSSMLLTLRSGSIDLDKLNMTTFIGSKGYIQISKLNNPSELICNGKIIQTSTDDGQTDYWLDNSHGLRFQADEVRKCIMQNRLTSDLHGANESILLIETIRKIMDECKFEVETSIDNFDFSDKNYL